MSIAASLCGHVPPIVADLWRWWTAELRSIWNALPLGGTGETSKSLIYLEPGRVIVERITDGQGERFVEDRDLMSFDEQSFDELRDLTGSSATTLLLSPPDVYVTRLTLPRAAATRLRSAIELQLPIIAPMKPELLAWTVADVQRVTENLDAGVAMIKLERLTVLRDFLLRNGCGGWHIGVVDWPGAVFDEQRSALGIISTLLNSKWLLGSIAALASIPLTIIVGATILSYQADQRADGLQEKARENRRIFRDATIREEQRQALMPLIASPGVAALLNDVTRNLPQTDWLRSFERHADGSIRFIVVTRDAESLDRALHEAKHLPGLHVVDDEPSGEGLVDVTYEAGAR